MVDSSRRRGLRYFDAAIYGSGLRYWDAQSDRAVLLLRFSLDMAKHIVGSAAESTMAPAFVSSAIPMLSEWRRTST